MKIGLRLDGYILQRLIWPFVLSLSCLMVAFLLDKLLRLFQAAASAGTAFGATLLMAGDLVPHYLQQALPAGLFAAIFIVVARLGDDNELDAMLAGGRSIIQISRPFFVVALLLSVFGVYLFGFWQPYARYAYHQERYDVSHAGWNARVQQNTFVDAGQGFTLTADNVGSTGRNLKHVFLQQHENDNSHLTITATRGSLVPTADGRHLLLKLSDGRMLREWGDGTASITDFRHGTVNENFSAGAPPFRPRGDAENELTLPELWVGMHAAAPPIARPKLSAAFNNRLARIFLLPLLPLLGVPLGMASKRGRRTPGVVFAVVAVLAVDHALRFGQGMAETGQLSAVTAIWVPWGIFALLCLWLFRQSLLRPGDNPVSRAVMGIENLIERTGRRVRPKRAAS